MSNGIYVYAFCAEPIECELVGLGDAEVRFVEAGGVHAAISAAPGGRLRAQRRSLAAHQRVLSAIAGETSALPTSFGLVAESEDVLVDAIEQHADELHAELDRVSGCVEMGVKLAWDVENVFEHLVAIDDELRGLRDVLAAAGDAADHEMRVAVGRRVDRILSGEREHALAVLSAAVGEVADEIVPGEPGTESELATITCLVRRDEIAGFEAAIESCASEFDDNHAFTIAGPFAPHNFVNLRLELGSPAA